MASEGRQKKEYLQGDKREEEDGKTTEEATIPKEGYRIGKDPKSRAVWKEGGGGRKEVREGEEVGYEVSKAEGKDPRGEK